MINTATVRVSNDEAQDIYKWANAHSEWGMMYQCNKCNGILQVSYQCGEIHLYYNEVTDMYLCNKHLLECYKNREDWYNSYATPNEETQKEDGCTFCNGRGCVHCETYRFI